MGLGSRRGWQHGAWTRHCRANVEEVIAVSAGERLGQAVVTDDKEQGLIQYTALVVERHLIMFLVT